MGLSTHVLDTMHGCPASAMTVSLWFATDKKHYQQLGQWQLNQDGRCEQGLLLEQSQLQLGYYRLVFAVGAYFEARQVALPQPRFLDEVTLDFGIADIHSHYHVPLLVSPWSYSTYRGS